MTKRTAEEEFSEKYLILQEVKKGESRNAVLNKYKISERTLRKIVQCADEITNKSHDSEFRNKKSMKSADNVELEAALFKWFIQKRDSGQPISGMMIQEKARIFNELLKGPKTFRASEGWFSRFKKRHGLKRWSIKGYYSRFLLSKDINSTEEFTKLLIEKIIRENLKLENIYNADESGIYWKILLNYICALLTEKSVAGFDNKKDRFTALFCANASGSHKIPLLIIGKSEPRNSKILIDGEVKLHDISYLKDLDVNYSAQESGWMNCEIFKKWYQHEFISRVLEHQKNTGNSGKVLLILDNAPSHPSAEKLNAIHDNFEVMFLPPNDVTLIQPMDQSTISTMKKLYKRNLMRRLLIEKNYEKIETFLKELKVSDCLVMLTKAWSSLKQSTLKNSWKALLPENIEMNSSENSVYAEDSFKCEINDSVEESNSIREFSEHLAKCLSEGKEEGEEMSKRVKLKIEEWFNADEGDSGCEMLSDAQIVEFVLNRKDDPDDLVNSSMDVEQTEYIPQDLGRQIGEEEKIAASEAHECFLKFKNWMMARVQCSASQIRHFTECEKILKNAIDNFQG
ncbi:tigger transposable element-derived protein 2-like isoform X2 [Belonocnema kinseyi]|uniref:tigger transposable element-derived protein 2-like isoform X2 n=1 Tax=Belonocnema kinseyi TaxID=2817044 RepID=UPI00143D83DF|nr:tigger transposable element-derived protein 2-like isoform X2 [Belonocnema kinseyi]